MSEWKIMVIWMQHRIWQLVAGCTSDWFIASSWNSSTPRSQVSYLECWSFFIQVLRLVRIGRLGFGGCCVFNRLQLSSASTVVSMMWRRFDPLSTVSLQQTQWNLAYLIMFITIPTVPNWAHDDFFNITLEWDEDFNFFFFCAGSFLRSQIDCRPLTPGSIEQWRNADWQNAKWGHRPHLQIWILYHWNAHILLYLVLIQFSLMNWTITALYL